MMDMQVPPATDRLANRIESALQQARLTARLLDERITPHMPPASRRFVIEIADKIGRDRIFTNTMIREIEALIDTLGREAEPGIHYGWHADEHHSEGGWRITYLSEQAKAFLAGADSLLELRDAIAGVVDIRRSHAIAGKLTGTDCPA